MIPEHSKNTILGPGSGTPCTDWSHDYFFWTGRGLRKSAVADWQRSLKRVFADAKVSGNAHMFRHTFATDLLTRGVPIEDVAILLGHQPSDHREVLLAFRAGAPRTARGTSPWSMGVTDPRAVVCTEVAWTR